MFLFDFSHGILIIFLFCSLIMISNAISIGGFMEYTCFTTDNIPDTSAMNCSVEVEGFNISMTHYIDFCIKCVVRNPNISIPSDCRKKYDCYVFVFNDNIIFENFFMKHRSAMQEHYPKATKVEYPPFLSIIVENYNKTQITNHYLNSTLNIDLPNLVVHLKFIRPISNRAAITIADDSFSLNIREIRISVLCPINSDSKNYFIKGNTNFSKPVIEDQCKRTAFTTTVSINDSHISKGEKTDLNHSKTHLIINISLIYGLECFIVSPTSFSFRQTHFKSIKFRKIMKLIIRFFPVAISTSATSYHRTVV